MRPAYVFAPERRAVERRVGQERLRDCVCRASGKSRCVNNRAIRRDMRRGESRKRPPRSCGVRRKCAAIEEQALRRCVIYGLLYVSSGERAAMKEDAAIYLKI